MEKTSVSIDVVIAINGHLPTKRWFVGINPKKYVYFTMWGLEVSDLKGQIRRNTKTLTKTPV